MKANSDPTISCHIAPVTPNKLVGYLIQPKLKWSITMFIFKTPDSISRPIIAYQMYYYPVFIINYLFYSSAQPSGP